MKKRHYLGNNYPGIYLTPREAECMICLLNEMTMAEVANELRLSRRTVEYYVNNIKLKLNCIKLRELIRLVRRSDFGKNISAAI